MPSSRLRRRRGFTLLEVMIAVLILAVGLSSLFTSEAGAVRIAQKARTTTIATLLARCKMGELEERIAKEGWPAERFEERDECCEDGEREGYSCESAVERIKLPDVADEDEDEGDSDDDDEGKKERTPGVFDQLAELSKEDPSERMGALTDMLTGGSGEDSEREKRPKGERDEGESSSEEEEEESELDPIASLVMELAFPVMKPVIEEGVRRANVTVKWKEGDREQTLELVQFLVTEEQIILPEDDEGDGGVASPSTTPAGSSGSPTQGAKLGAGNVGR